MNERIAIAGSGAIACGLATTASPKGEVLLLARSEPSAERARTTVEKLCGRVEGASPDTVRVTTDMADLRDATVVVEAIAEDLTAKSALLRRIGGVLGDDTLLATTTSSLSIEELAAASGRPDRFAGLHVFNPVPRMALVELAFPQAATQRTRERAHALCEALGKTAVEVPDVPGFVVNRLLFPYLFSAVRLLEETGLDPEAIDACMVMGAGHPMGPLALLDLVGLDVSQAIGEAIGADVPAGVRDRVQRGELGRKTGRGFHVVD
ncbi:MAG TPA: 3-hydroxyacyl-CoA dehydrogenase family protein [Solirubrobacteraceae bacterium]|nr:3-hydroxyacyl-CoA dehydrogenase family protein [Solirubrobacteraceae bacterium]